MSLLDRSWLDTWVAFYRRPLALPTIDTVHEFLHAVIENDPRAVVACRLDRATMRWMPVPASERAAHVERLAIGVEDPAIGAEREHIRWHTPPWYQPEPFRLVLGQESAVLYCTHGIGDYRTHPALLKSLVECDRERWARLEPRAKESAVLRVVAVRCIAHPGDAARFIRTALTQARPTGPTPLTERDEATAATGPPPLPEPREPGPGAASSIAISFHDLSLRDQARRWRDEHAPGVSVAATVTCAIYFALHDSGLNVDPGTFHIMFDARRFIAERHRTRAGNLAKGLYLSADLSDPRSISAATTDAINKFRVIPAMAAMMLDAARPRRGPQSEQPAQPLQLNLSWIGTENTADPLPWLPGREKTSYGVGCAVQPYSIDVIVSPTGNRFAVTATFDARHTDPQRVQHALDSLANIEQLLLPVGGRSDSDFAVTSRPRVR